MIRVCLRSILPGKCPEVGWQRLLDVQAQAVLQRALVPVGCDVRLRIDTAQKSDDRFSIIPHIGGIEIR